MDVQNLLTPPVLEKLKQYQGLVEKWTPRINLVGRSTVADIWDRHIIDSLRLCALDLPLARRWVDLGSGGGFPGLVVAVVLACRGDRTEVVLVESDARKAVFLRQAARQLGLTTTVHAERAESLPPQHADVVSARALAPLDRLCEIAHRHLAPSGVCLFPKGEKAEEEIAVARRSWRFELDAVDNKDHKRSPLLLLRNLERAA
jgi:16S rRNA (guanine527-N7)-methyltransferase